MKLTYKIYLLPTEFFENKKSIEIELLLHDNVHNLEKLGRIKVHHISGDGL